MMNLRYRWEGWSGRLLLALATVLFQGALLAVAGLAGWDDTISGYAYDPALAKKLLAQGSWVAGSNGTLAKDGAPPHLRLLSYSGVPAFQTAAEIIQADLQAIGLAVGIQMLVVATFRKNIQAGESDLALAGWSDQD